MKNDLEPRRQPVPARDRSPTHVPLANQPGVVLIATDFSASGNRAMEMGAALAALRGERISLLHVFEPPSISVPELGIDPGLELELRRRAEAQLAASANTLRARGLVVDERLAIGSPAAVVIGDVAAELAPSLVVLGSHGRRPLPRLLMGSVAEAALLRIQQPVVVVPQAAEAPRSLTGDGRT